jgi:hypothetical protein
MSNSSGRDRAAFIGPIRPPQRMTDTQFGIALVNTTNARSGYGTQAAFPASDRAHYVKFPADSRRTGGG